MWSILTDPVVWSVTLTLVSHAKMAEPIEMPFELRTRVDPRNHVLDGFRIPPCVWAILRVERGILL